MVDLLLFDLQHAYEFNFLMHHKKLIISCIISIKSTKMHIIIDDKLSNAYICTCVFVCAVASVNPNYFMDVLARPIAILNLLFSGGLLFLIHFNEDFKGFNFGSIFHFIVSLLIFRIITACQTTELLPKEDDDEIYIHNELHTLNEQPTKFNNCNRFNVAINYSNNPFETIDALNAHLDELFDDIKATLKNKQDDRDTKYEKLVEFIFEKLFATKQRTAKQLYESLKIKANEVDSKEFDSEFDNLFDILNDNLNNLIKGDNFDKDVYDSPMCEFIDEMMTIIENKNSCDNDATENTLVCEK